MIISCMSAQENASVKLLLQISSSIICIFITDNRLAALVVLPALLPDTRTKVDTNRVVHMAQVNIMYIMQIII